MKLAVFKIKYSLLVYIQKMFSLISVQRRQIFQQCSEEKEEKLMKFIPKSKIAKANRA
jgi:hypothetical protein